MVLPYSGPCNPLQYWTRYFYSVQSWFSYYKQFWSETSCVLQIVVEYLSKKIPTKKNTGLERMCNLNLFYFSPKILYKFTLILAVFEMPLCSYPILKVLSLKLFLITGMKALLYALPLFLENLNFHVYREFVFLYQGVIYHKQSPFSLLDSVLLIYRSGVHTVYNPDFWVVVCLVWWKFP